LEPPVAGSITRRVCILLSICSETEGGTFGAQPVAMFPICRYRRSTVLLLTLAFASYARATVRDAADHSIQQFLAQDDTQPQYRAVRRLEATNGSRTAWLEAVTEYSPAAGFRYEITAEGGSDLIRNKVLKAVLEGERDVIAHGETARSSLALANYRFQANGVDAAGLANVLLSPRRKERVLVAGTMFLKARDGDLVRVQGRLAKSPSFWVKNVDIVRSYESIDGAVVPIALETTAQVRFLGKATLRMTYAYQEINRHAVVSPREEVVLSSSHSRREYPRHSLQ
jgi:hypothetical protein